MKSFFYLMLIMLIVGAGYQFVSTVRDEMKYPAPGKLVDIGGYKLHIQISGKDSGPTVVLEAGGGCHSLHFSLVQPEIEKFARVVSYDRAGYGWSEASPKPRNSENMVEELRLLLEKSGVQGPYILVGHSFGGLNVRLYANKYPNEVVGVVLADAVHEDQPYILPSSESLLKKCLEYSIARSVIRVAGFLGLFRLSDFMHRPNQYSPEIYEMILAKAYTMNFLNTAFSEYSQFQVSQAQVKASGSLGDKPLIVISAGTCRVPQEFWESWQTFQKDLVTKSNKGKQVIALKSGHKMNQEAPEIIAEAVREMVFKEW